MEILYPRCAGLDIHKKSLVACILFPDSQGHQSKQFHSFSTMLSDLQRLRDLLTSLCVTHVAMESTGVFWKPIYNVLEDHFTLLVVNAQLTLTRFSLTPIACFRVPPHKPFLESTVLLECGSGAPFILPTRSQAW